MKFHVLQGESLPEDDSQPVAGQSVRVRGGLVHPAGATRREDDGFGVEDVDVAGRQLVCDDAGGNRTARRLGERQVQGVELVEELHIVFDAVLIERLQDHVPRAVRGVAGPAHGALPWSRVWPPNRRWSIRPSGVRLNGIPIFQIEDGVDRLLAHHLDGVLVGEVVAALDGVERATPSCLLRRWPVPRTCRPAPRRCGCGLGTAW